MFQNLQKLRRFVKNISITHDLTKKEREELRKLISEAKRKEQCDPSRTYIYWVHGPPWGWFISLHVRSMWETICDAQAGFWLNSKFLSKFSRKPLSGISDQKAPPPPFRKTSDLRWPKFTPEYPPPFQKTSDLRWPKFTPEYPPPPFGKCGRSYVETNL